MVEGVQSIRRCGRIAWRAGNIALLCLVAACGGGTASVDVISQEQAEAVRDECVGESLRLLRELADRLAPLARAAGPEEREAIAYSVGCVRDGDRYVCDELGLELLLEEYPDGLAMLVHDLDPWRGVTGELRLHEDASRGLVFEGHLHRTAADGCAAVLGFDELLALEAYGLDDGGLGLFFSEGAVGVTVHAPDDGLLASGTAALTGRRAFVALNFDGRQIVGEIALD